MYNEHLARVPGLYNDQCKVEITYDALEHYDFLNLTVTERTQHLNEHFNIIREHMQKQLNI